MTDGALAALALALAACGTTAGRPLPPGHKPRGPAAGMSVGHVAARGLLAYDATFDANGTHLATIELSTRFELVVRDLAAGGDPIRIVLGKPDYDVVDLALDPKGTRAAVASLDGTVRLFDLAARTETANWRLDAPATAVAFSPDGGWLATGADSGVLCLRRVDDGALVQCVAAHEKRLAALAFTPGGEALASAGWDGQAIVWESPSLAELARARRGGVATALAFSPDGRALAVARALNPPKRTTGKAEHDPAVGIDLWTWPDGAGGVLRTLTGHGAAVVSLAFTPDGTRLVTGSWDRTVALWDPETGRRIARLGGFSHVVRAVDVSPDGRRVAVASWSGNDRKGRSVTLVDLLYP